MKQCLKLFPLVLLLALFLTAPGRAAGTKSEAETRLAIQTPESAVKKGEEFSVTVVLSGNPGFHSAGLTLTYDKSAMECTGIEKGSVLKGSMDVLNPDGANGAVVSAISLRMMSGNGVLAEFFFQAVKPLDAFPFALTEVTLTDFDGKELPCTAPSLFADISGDVRRISGRDIPPASGIDAGRICSSFVEHGRTAHSHGQNLLSGYCNATQSSPGRCPVGLCVRIYQRHQYSDIFSRLAIDPAGGCQDSVRVPWRKKRRGNTVVEFYRQCVYGQRQNIRLGTACYELGSLSRTDSGRQDGGFESRSNHDQSAGGGSPEPLSGNISNARGGGIAVKKWIVKSVLLCMILLLPCVIALAADPAAADAEFRNANTPGDKVIVTFPGAKKASIVYADAVDDSEYILLLTTEELTLGSPPTVSSVVYMEQKTGNNGVQFTAQVRNPSLNQRFFVYMSSNADSGITLGELVATFDYAVEPPVETYDLGDVNHDSKITTADALLALRLSAGTLPDVTEAARAAADVNKDDKITIADALLILRKSSNPALNFSDFWLQS